MVESDKMQTPPLKYSNAVAYFAVGTVLLVVPLVLILIWGGSSCIHNPSQFQCVSTSTFKMAASFLPFVMLVGGVLIGYKMKKISDSLIPRDERADYETEDESDSH